MKTIHVPVGHRYGMLTVQAEGTRTVQPSGQGQRTFQCVCDCGRTKVVRLSHLRHGQVRSCGCLLPSEHGLTNTPLYNSWRGMKMRCYWSGYSEARLYSERGIQVCAEWKDDFLAFAAWANANGYAPGLTIDRIDNALGYEPTNCRWATPKQNCNNRRCTTVIEYMGRKGPFTEVLHGLGLAAHEATIRRRITRGWSATRAIDTPIRVGNYRKARVDTNPTNTIDHEPHERTEAAVE